MRCNQARDFGVSACIFDSGDRQRMKNTFVIQDDDLISDANLGGSLNSLMSLEGQDKQSECQAYSQAIGKAELQDLFPWVPVREVNFLRFCKQHVDGVWVVVDANIDTIRETSDLNLNPSTLQLVQNFGNLPMVAKLLFEILLDALYIWGAHRVPYICIGGFVLGSIGFVSSCRSSPSCSHGLCSS
ncbi:hypothetical protein V6N12_037293 [Hibiscus sabdariffa]|uniref:Uncharacterized protein n=1 Tax=Hibiscus sabdariffa TaxID=183260 RepID=A0ABR2C3S3_9ROSI